MSANPNTGGPREDPDGGGGLTTNAVRGILSGIIASGAATVLITIVDQFRSAGGQARSSFVSIGGTFRSTGETVGTILLEDVFAVPFEVVDSVAASAGPLAPLVAPAAWALAAALIGGVFWTIWRVLRWL